MSVVSVDTYQVEWRLLATMTARNIRRSPELQQRLEQVGVYVTTQQLNRLINQGPERLNMKLLLGLTLVLECGVDDLIQISNVYESSQKKRIEQVAKNTVTAEKALPPGF